jgi:hypothetical protein
MAAYHEYHLYWLQSSYACIAPWQFSFAAAAGSGVVVVLCGAGRWWCGSPSICLLVRRRVAAAAVVHVAVEAAAAVAVASAAAVGPRAADQWADEPGHGFLVFLFYEIFFAES